MVLRDIQKIELFFSRRAARGQLTTQQKQQAIKVALWGFAHDHLPVWRSIRAGMKAAKSQKGTLTERNLEERQKV
jgi:hypothetical protein